MPSHEKFCNYDLKPLLLLILIFVVYQILGAVVFYWCETNLSNNDDHRNNSADDIIRAPEEITSKILLIIKENFKLKDETIFQVEKILIQELNLFKQNIENLKQDNKIQWDFWTAMLYAQTLCTTIGYGNSYTTTTLGRILTMIYSLIGIPLVLSILDYIGTLVTICLQKLTSVIKFFFMDIYYWILPGVHKKYACKLDKTCIIDFDEHNIPVKISLIFVAIWIGLCAGISCLWEDWGYFEAFYFFFISLSTIGLGELMPTQPQYLLLMFVKIMIGLTLFSICITSIQHALENLLSHCLSKLRATEEEEEEIDEFDVEPNHKQHISLGVFRSYGSNFSLNKLHPELNNNINKGSQTILNNKINIKSFIRRTPSFEDVVKVINEIEDHEIEDVKLQEEIDRNNNNKENSADSFELLYNKKTCRCCLALANGSIVTSILLHRYSLRNNLMQCPSYLSSLTSLNTRKFVKLKHNEKLKIKQIEDHTLLMP